MEQVGTARIEFRKASKGNGMERTEGIRERAEK
jgi:hypothetical protein